MIFSNVSQFRRICTNSHGNGKSRGYQTLASPVCGPYSASMGLVFWPTDTETGKYLENAVFPRVARLLQQFQDTCFSTAFLHQITASIHSFVLKLHWYFQLLTHWSFRVLLTNATGILLNGSASKPASQARACGTSPNCRVSGKTVWKHSLPPHLRKPAELLYKME